MYSERSLMCLTNVRVITVMACCILALYLSTFFVVLYGSQTEFQMPSGQDPDNSNSEGNHCVGHASDTNVSPSLHSRSIVPGPISDSSKSLENSDSSPGPKNSHVTLDQLELVVAKQKVQLDKLEELVRRFHIMLDELQNGLLVPSSKSKDIESSHIPKDELCVDDPQPIVPKPKMVEGTLTSVQNVKIKDELEINKESQADRGRGLTIASYKPAWSEHFQLLSAVKVEGEVTCLHVLPHEGEDGLSRYVAVGGNAGRLYIFLSQGDLLVDIVTPSVCPITAMLSFLTRPNETVLLTGHSDGSVLMYKLSELANDDPSSDDTHTLHLQYVQSLSSSSQITPNAYTRDCSLISEDDNSVKILEVYRVGKMRYILASHAEGRIEVFRENGTFYGETRASNQPLAFLRTPNSQRLLFLTRDGASTLDLRSLSVQDGSCEGLNGSRVIAYAFDAAGRSKAYGFTEQGDMVFVALSGDTLHFECHVRSRRKLELQGPVVPQCIRGYLLVATEEQVLVFNTTSQIGYAFRTIPAGTPRLLFAAPIEDIILSFLKSRVSTNGQLTMACNRDRFVAIGFGNGYVGFYRSNLSIYKHDSFNSQFWRSPLIVIIAILLGGWYIFGRKRDVPLLMNDDLLDPSVPSYYTAGFDESRENLTGYASTSKAFAGSGYSPEHLKFRNTLNDQSLRTPSVEPPLFRGPSTVEHSLRSTSLDHHVFQKLDHFRGPATETSLQSTALESNSLIKRETLDLKPKRVSSLGTGFRSISEPNSF